MTAKPPLLGVLGGMGPFATVDFLTKLIEETGAERDEHHVPVVVYSVPQIPSRPAAIMHGGASPLPAMLEGVRVLKGAGASAIAIACNTAHYWYDALQLEAGVPILHIADAACDTMAESGALPRAAGLIGTRGTLHAAFFQERLEARGVACIVSTEEEQAELVEPAILAVKRHALAAAHPLAVQACERLAERGAESIIMACTEIPPALEYASHPFATRCVDPTRALARACVRWWRMR
ncbi:MAG TPA: amino acid racemase [Burkholderiales bacterium]|nr:amino acid racemase [Burkholderiales bacterium]